MEYPKAMYKATPEGVVEEIVMSDEDMFSLEKAGWYRHPQEARNAGVEIVETAPEPRKPGRPRK